MCVARRAVVLALVLVSSALAGCRPPPEPESYVPQDVALVVAIPQLEQAFAAYQELEKRFTSIPELKTEREKLVEEARKHGLPFDKESLAAQGVNTKQGLYFFVPPSGDRGCLLAGVKNRFGVDGLLMNLFKKGGDEPVTFHPVAAGGLTVTEVRERNEDRGSVSWVHHKKTLVLCVTDKKGESASEYTAKIAQRDPAQGLMKAEDMKGVRTTLGTTQAWAYLGAEGVKKWILDEEKKKKGPQKLDKPIKPIKKPKAPSDDPSGDGEGASDDDLDETDEPEEKSPFDLTSMLDEFKGYRSMSFGLALSGQEVTVRTYLHSTPERAAEDRRIGTGTGPAPRFAAFLPSGGPALVLRVSGNIPAIVQSVKKRLGQVLGADKIDGVATEARNKLGLDVEKDVLGVFSGRFLLGVDPPSPELLTLGMQRGAMGVVPELPVYLLAQVTDRQQAAKLLGSVEKILTDLNVPVTGSEGPVYAVLDKKPSKLPDAEPPQAMVRFGLAGDVLMVSGGGYFLKVQERSRAAGPAKFSLGSPQVTTAVQSADDSVIFLDLVQLTSLVRAVSLIKPDPEVTKALPVMDQLRDIALISQWRNDGALVDLQLRLR